MLAPVEVLTTIVVGYLVGSIPVANTVARQHGVTDLRTVGDRNPGFWNALQLLGLHRAWPVLVGDAAKGALAAGLGTLIGPWWLGYLGLGAAMIGHAWPLFAGGRGGRSVATFLGGVVVLAPVPVAIAAVAGVIAGGISRRVEWGVRVAVFAVPVAQLAIEGADRAAGTGCLMTLIGLRFWQAARSDRRCDRATSNAA